MWLVLFICLPPADTGGTQSGASQEEHNVHDYSYKKEGRNEAENNKKHKQSSLSLPSS